MKGFLISLFLFTSSFSFGQGLSFITEQINTSTTETIVGLCAELSGDIWACSSEKKVYKRQSGIWLEIEVPSISDVNNFTDIACTADGMVFLTTDNMGVWIYSNITNTWSNLNTSNSSIPNNGWINVVVQNSQDVFFLSEAGIIYRFNDMTWIEQSFNAASFITEKIMVTNPYEAFGYSGSTIVENFVDDSWFDENYTTFFDENYTINDVFIDNQRTKWVATNKSIYKYGSTLTDVGYISDDLVVDQIAKDNGFHLWMYLENGNIMSYNTNNTITYTYRKSDYNEIPDVIFDLIPSGSGTILFYGNNGMKLTWASLSTISNTEELNKVSVKVSPNPTNDKLNFVYSDMIPTSIKITNISGQQVFSCAGSTQSIVISDFPTGSYIVTFGFKDHIESVQIVKQ